MFFPRLEKPPLVGENGKYVHQEHGLPGVGFVE
jgi:hypothetical protein